MNKVQVIQEQLQQLCFLQLQLIEIELLLESSIDLLVFHTQYSFIFDEQISEIPPVTEAPARDGVNWYAYFGGNPVNRYDWTGLDDCYFESSADMYQYLSTVSSNPLYNCAAALPDMTSITMEDVSCSVNTMDPKGSAVMLSVQTASKFTRGLGDVYLNYKTINKSVVAWYINRITSNGESVYFENFS